MCGSDMTRICQCHLGHQAVNHHLILLNVIKCYPVPAMQHVILIIFMCEFYLNVLYTTVFIKLICSCQLSTFNS